MKTLNVSGGIYFTQGAALVEAERCRGVAVARVLNGAESLPVVEVVAISNNGAIIGWIVTVEVA